VSLIYPIIKIFLNAIPDNLFLFPVSPVISPVNRIVSPFTARLFHPDWHTWVFFHDIRPPITPDRRYLYSHKQHPSYIQVDHAWATKKEEVEKWYDVNRSIYDELDELKASWHFFQLALETYWQSIVPQEENAEISWQYRITSMPKLWSRNDESW